MIAKLVETKWLTRYPWPTGIMYDQESEFINPEFKNYLIQEEYVIKAKHSTLGNPTSNMILERLHSVLG